MPRVIVGVTGASGSCYADRLIRELVTQEIEAHVIVTDAGIQVVNHELGLCLKGDVEADQERLRKRYGSDRVRLYDNRQIGATIASGSVPMDAMVVMPASMGTVSGIATGRSINLLERSADVMLKENRKVIIVPRETPLNQIHLENLLKLSRMGVDIIPAMPAFYQRPQTIEDLVKFLVGRVLEHLGIRHALYDRWEGEA